MDVECTDAQTLSERGRVEAGKEIGNRHGFKISFGKDRWYYDTWSLLMKRVPMPALECCFAMVRPMITSIDAFVQVLAMLLRKLPGFPLPH